MKLTKEQKEYIIKEYNEGRGKPTLIAKKLGLPVSTVAGVAFRRGITASKNYWKSKEDKVIMDAIAKGGSFYVKDAASKLPGRTYSAVTTRIYEMRKKEKPYLTSPKGGT